MAQVRTSFVTDEKDIRAALERMNREMTNLRSQNQKLQESSKQGGQTAVGFLKAQIASVGSLAASYGGLQTILQSITAEMEKQRGLGEKARLEQLEFADVVREAKGSFRPDKSTGDRSLESIIQELAADPQVRTDEKKIAKALQTGFSAKGDLENALVIEAVREAFRLQPGNLEQAEAMVGAAVDLAKVTGQSDMRGNLGFVQNIAKSARETTGKEVAESLVPAVTSLTRQGMTPEEAAELTVALNQLMGGGSGKSAATAAIGLGEQLGEFVPKRSAGDERGKFRVPQEQIDRFEQADLSERMQVLRESPELRRAFFAQASFEKKAAASVRALLEGQESAMAALEAAQRDILDPTDPRQSEEWERQIQEFESGPFQPSLTAEQRGEASTRRHRLDDLDGLQREATARRLLMKSLEEVDLPGIDHFAEREVGRLFDDPHARRVEDPHGLRGPRSEIPEQRAAELLLEYQGRLSPGDERYLQERIDILIDLQKQNNELLQQQLETQRDERRDMRDNRHRVSADQATLAGRQAE